VLERAAERELRPAVVDLRLGGKREPELDEPVVEERQAGLDGEGHRVPVLVVEKRRKMVTNVLDLPVPQPLPAAPPP
jgi:hypothetical protein